MGEVKGGRARGRARARGRMRARWAWPGKGRGCGWAAEPRLPECHPNEPQRQKDFLLFSFLFKREKGEKKKNNIRSARWRGGESRRKVFLFLYLYTAILLFSIPVF